MNFSDSPRESALYPLQSSESPLQIAQAPFPDESSERPSSDRLGDVISPNPNRSLRNEQTLIPPSPSAPSSRGLSATRPFPTSSEGPNARSSIAEGQNSSRQRVSFEGSHSPAATPNNNTRTNIRIHPLLRETIPQTSRGVDSTPSRPMGPSRHSPAVRSARKWTTHSPKWPTHESIPTASTSHSRATSPIRLFNWSGFHHAEEDAFVPVDPFRIRSRLRRLSLHGSDTEHHLSFDPTCEENPFCCLSPPNCSPKDTFFSFLHWTRDFFLDTLPRQIYLHLLFRLPSLYFSRIARLYEDAELSRPDLERMVESYSSSRQQEQRERIIGSSPIPPGAHYHPAPALPFPDEWTTATVSPALVRFKHSWETFIDSLLREWKTLNLVSALLHTGILSMFQNQVMADDPIIRTAALLSLMSALMSLSYGCMYIIRFGTMKSMDKATRWAEEAARTTTFILWNVWVLLAMPAIWLAWSMIFFVVAILVFVWRYGSSTDPASPQPLSPTAAIGPRVAVSALFCLGLLYLAAIVKTLHNYGRSTENRASRRVLAVNGNRDTPETDMQGGEQDNQRGRGLTRDLVREENHALKNRQSARNVREPTEPGGLSAVTGLGLKGLDEFANPQNLGEMAAERNGATG